MPKGYWIVHVDVTDPERYAQYLAEDAKAFAKYDAKPVVRGGRYEAPEDKTHSRHVILEFESFDKARECYHSPEYQRAVAHRLAASESYIVLVEGVD
jgi:uncharacterized protein (DUF1330 family)